MSKRNLILFLLVAIVFLVVAGIPTNSENPGDEQEIIVGRNVNMVAGTQLPKGDPWLQRQNEPSIAVSTRNPLHLLAGANDYRTVDWPIPGEEIPGFEKTNAARDAWLGVFKSFDGGQSWISMLLPGFPQDTSPEGVSSPLFGLTAATDPTVRAGTNGLFFYSGIAFDRVEHGRSVVFVTRFIDNNNKEKGDPIKYLDSQIIAEGTGRQFIDKPWIATDIPRTKKPKIVMIDGQAIPKSNVYITYSTFLGDFAEDIPSKVYFALSEDCGANWFNPVKLSESHQINQGTTIGVDPGTGDIYVAWRRFGSEGESDAVLVAASTDGGQKFSKPKKVADITPFDQGTTPSSFRSNCFPTIAVDNGGIVYVAWSERGMGPGGEARIVIATSDNGGKNWSIPKKIDSTIDEYEPGHQIMPSLTFADGKLMMVWYDQRDDVSGRFTEFIDDWPGQPRHTLDVRVSQAAPGTDPQFAPSKRVSRYLFILTGEKYNYNVQQIQFNFVNYTLFKQGTVPFIGDYMDITPSPVFVLDETGQWRYNTDTTDSTVFHAVWTDNRDVRPPPDGLWTDYSPPSSIQEDPNFYTDNSCTEWTKTGMRNQNIYTARITEGIVVGSPGNTKPLGTLGETPEGEPIPRAFVVTVSNTTAEIRCFRLTIANQPPDAPPSGEGRASFLEFEFLDWMDVEVAPFSSVSRTVFVHSSDPKATVRVSVDEIDAPNGDIIDGGLASYVLLNPDIQNPDIQNPDIQNPDIQNPDIQNFEVHNPDIMNWYVNPDIMNPDIQNPDIMNPDIQNPDIMNPDIMNPDIQNPDIQNPDIMNPDIQNPDIMNPDIMNPDIMNTAIADPSAGEFVDVIWEIQNIGNTTSSYIFRTLSTAADEEGNLPEGIQAQLLVYRVYSTPAEYDTQNNPCDLGKQEHHELVLNIINPDIQNPDIQNMDFKTPDIQNPDIQNATFSLEPEGEAKVVLRLWRPFDQAQTTSRGLNTRETLDFNNPVSIFESFGSFISSTAGNTTDRQDGIPTFPSDSSFFMITTKVLDPGEIGVLYSDFLEAAGGEGDLTWSVTGLPGGLYLADSATGEIGGEPTTAGTFSFTAQVTDEDSQIRTKDVWITIRPPGAEVYTISGRVALDGTGLPGVEMVGLPGNPITDSAGYYSDSVPPGWSGTVEPFKEEFIFDPPTKYYDSVDSDLATYYKAYDITPPIVAVTDPETDKAVNNASYLIQGTASDIGSGLASVEVSIDNGSTWALASGTSSWAYSATLVPGANVVKARATDNSGNVSAPTPGVTLTFDALSPTLAAVTTPSHENYYNASTMPASFQGVVADDSGGCGLSANSSQFYIQNSDGNFWNGSTWVASIQWLATSHAATSNGTQTSWTDAVNLPTWSDGIYYTRAKATDKAGNSYEGSEITFYYDSTGIFFLDHFDFDTISSPQIAGVTFSITITAKDMNGNTIPTYEGTNTLSDTTGTISPTTTGNFTAGGWTGDVTISTTQLGEMITTTGGGKSGTSDSFDVIAPLEITTTSLTDAVKGSPYSEFLQATGVPPLNWSLAEGSSLPDGLSLIPATGEISGTPTESGNFNFTVEVTDAIAQFDSQDLSLTVAEWVARYNGPVNGLDAPAAITVDSSGNVYATGFSPGSGTGDDYATLKYDSYGNELWIARYNGPGNGQDWSIATSVDSVGSVYVTGLSYGSGTGGDYATIKYNSNGNELWVARYNSPGNGNEFPLAMFVDSSGNVYVTGRSSGSGTGYDYATVKYDSNGNELWVARYNGPGNGFDQTWSIAVDSPGNVYVTGWSPGSGTDYDYATIKYDSNGNELWVARYNGPGNGFDASYDIAVDSSGNVYVTGRCAGSGTGDDYATIKYDSNGNELWVSMYNGPGNGNDWGRSIAVDSPGNVYVTGGCAGSGTGDDYATLKYDSNGNELWVSMYNGPGNGNDHSYDSAIDSVGSVYVTGSSPGNLTGNDSATIKYDSSGNELWVARYNGPGNSYDDGSALAIDSLGNVHVIVASVGSGTESDYATIKYSQSFPSTLIISTETLDNGYAGVPYAATVWGFGGSGSRTWSIFSGDLPPGLDLDTSTGIISGTPTTAGTYNFTVQVVDGALSDTQDLSITINTGTAAKILVETEADGSGAVVPAQDVPAGTSITVYSIARDAFDNFVSNVAADSWLLENITGGVVAGDLVPAGDMMSAVFTAHLTGSANIHAEKSGLASTDSGTLTAIFGSLDHFDFDPIPIYQVTGVPFSITITAKDVIGNTVTSYSGTNTLVLSQAGTLSPTTTGPFAAGVWTGEVTISTIHTGVQIETTGDSSSGNSDSFDVIALFEITTTWLPDAVKDSSYSSFMRGAGGVSPYIWSLAAGSSLPLGLDLNSATGEISGTPTESGFFNFTIEGIDQVAQFDSQDLSFTVAEWAARYDGPGNAEDYTLDIVLDTSGNVYVTGYSMGDGTGRDYATAKYDSSGNQLWIARYDGVLSLDDLVRAITLDSLGNVYVTGESYGSGTGPDYVTVKYNNSGAQQWFARYNGPANGFEDSATDIAVDSSGNVYVTGYSVGNGAGLDYATVKYDSSGQELWVARYDGGIGGDEAWAIAVDSEGNVYVTGKSSGGPTETDYVTVKYDNSGVQQWVAKYDGLGSSWDSASTIAVDLLGNVYVTGSSRGSGTDNDYATVKYDSSGTQLWVARYDGPAHGADSATSIALDSAGNIYVTGPSSGSGTGSDYATVKYDSSGQELWVARYNGPKNGGEFARAVAVDPEENVYVTGQSDGVGTAYDYATVKYDSSGTQLWVGRYDGPFSSHDVAYAIALDSLGNVHVTGGCAGIGVYMDYATVKYSQSFPSTLIISTETLDNGYAGVPYAATVWGFGGSGSRTWSIFSGDLPPGLDLDTSTSIISGTPTTVGIYNFAVQVTDGALSDTQDLSITINTGTATQAELFGPESVVAGSVSGVFTLKSRDSFGNDANVEGDTVFSLSSTSSGTATFYSDAAGINEITQATITNGESFTTFYYKNTQAGDQTVTATYSTGPIDLGSDNHLITIAAAAASKLAFTQSPGGCTAGEVWIQQPVVKVQDLHNNTITSDNSTQVTLTIDNNPNNGTLSGTITVTVSAGVATFAGLSIDNSGVGYTLEATSAPSYTSTTSDAFVVNAKMTGTLKYDGAPITNMTPQQLHFQLSKDGQHPPISFEYDDTTGEYTILTIPPGAGQINLGIHIDAADPFDGKRFPGDFTGWEGSIPMAEGQSVIEQDVNCLILIHITDPIDNLSSVGPTPPDSNDESYDTYTSPIGIQWDAINEASIYRIKVDKYQHSPDFSFIENVDEIYTSNTQETINLELSAPGEHYQFSLRAYKEMYGEWLGTLTIIYDNAYGDDYRFRIIPGPASQVELSGPASVGAGSISGEFTLESQDSAGNPSSVTGDTVFDLSSTSGGNATFYSDAGGTNEITQVTILSGQSSATFYYRDIVVGTPTVTATWSSGGADLGSDSHAISVIAAPANQVVISGPQKAGGGFISEAFILESQDGLGNPSNVTGDTVFDLSSNSGGIATFYSDSEGTNEITQVTILSGQSSVSFYYEDAVVGTPTVTATFNTGPTPLGSDDQQITVWAVVGQIAFASDRDGNYEIYIMNADGLGQTRLTNNSAIDQFPSWSPDGSKIAFMSDRDGNDEIYIMNADGSWQTNLTNNSASDQFPSWSPDGSKIAFASYRDENWEIYIMNADGLGQTNKTNNPASDYRPSWSPDGNKIVFTSDRDGNDEIYVMNADGSDQTNKTNNLAGDAYPCWSPDGSKIAFSSNRDANYEIYVMNADGSGPMRLTTDPAYDRFPSWSSDGSKIAFESDRDGNWEIYVMDADGSGQTNLTNNTATSQYPSWGGSKIAYRSDRDGNSEIYIMNSDGSGQTNLTNDTAVDTYPSWSPDGTQIAFVSDRDGNLEIYVMNADGSGQTNVTNNSAVDSTPCWSPDGTQIAFVSDRTGGGDIYVMNADGTNEIRLTTNLALDTFPSWSPYGSKIAFVSTRDGNYEIYVMNTNGSEQTRLTTNSTSDNYPSWSPDGNEIAFTSERDGNYEIYVMNADGLGVTRLTTTPPNYYPSWSPDGSKIAFTSIRDGHYAIYVMNADGTEQTDLTTNSWSDREPSWRPQPRIIPHNYEFVTKWGSEGTGDGQFNHPTGIAVDNVGYVYVADSSNHRIQKFTSSGGFVTQWGNFGFGDGQFNHPSGIAVDSSGYVYVTDFGSHRIQKFTSSGVFVTKWGSGGTGDGQFDNPCGIAVDSSGYVYVTDSSNHRIQKFTSSGVFVTKWGSYGIGESQFHTPAGISVDSSGYVYVAEYNNNRIQKFTSSGVFVTKWGSYGSEDGQFRDPYGLAIDNNEYVYVADSYNHRIQKFTLSGSYITKWGSTGDGDGQFNNPYEIAVDSSGYVYVTDRYNHRVQKFQKK